jgi:NAD(P)H-dependent flavin oxidoreductase YrpB (nitropropane dioxygenase family)
MLRTPVCELLNVEYPILSAGMGAAAGPELAAAVSNAGGCGVMGAGGAGPEFVKEMIRQVRRLTDRSFGFNYILDDENDEQETEPVDAALEEGLPLVVLFWGNPRAFVQRAHRQGAKLFIQVGSVNEAKRAADAGVDAIIAQGSEAGGHVRGTTALSVIVPEVVDAVKPLPVLASGGIAEGRGLAAALALGAQGVSIGTRFLASEEMATPRRLKQAVVDAHAQDTLYVPDLFDVGWPNAPHRVIRNRVVEEWEAAGRPPSGQKPGEGTIVGRYTLFGNVIREVKKYQATTPHPDFDGDLELMPHWGGQSCSLVRDIKPAGQIVRDLVSEAEEVIQGLQRMVSAPEPAQIRPKNGEWSG